MIRLRNTEEYEKKLKETQLKENIHREPGRRESFLRHVSELFVTTLETNQHVDTSELLKEVKLVPVTTTTTLALGIHASQTRERHNSEEEEEKEEEKSFSEAQKRTEARQHEKLRDIDLGHPHNTSFDIVFSTAKAKDKKRLNKSQQAFPTFIDLS